METSEKSKLQLKQRRRNRRHRLMSHIHVFSDCKLLFNYKWVTKPTKTFLLIWEVEQHNPVNKLEPTTREYFEISMGFDSDGNYIINGELIPESLGISCEMSLSGDITSAAAARCILKILKSTSFIVRLLPKEKNYV